MWRLLRPLLFLMDAERVHELTMSAFALLMRIGPLRALVRRLCGARSAALRTKLGAVELPSPIGLAAGFDKDARWYNGLGALGFGLVEVGTLTAHAQPGNERPRLFRLPRDRAILNRFGFNNRGSADAAARLEGAEVEPVLGVNIGRSKITGNDEAVADYLLSLERLWPFARYVVVNVSSPNTAGLRDLQAREPLAQLLGALAERNRELAQEYGAARPPLLVKIAPDLTDDGIDSVVELVQELGLDGIVATNTTISRDGLATPAADVERLGAGGLSGAPLTARSREVVRRIHQRTGGAVPVIGVGGVMTLDDAWELFRAGASVVQVYTGFIYGGPLFVRALNRGLERRLREQGYGSISELVGAANREQDDAAAAAPAQ